MIRAGLNPSDVLTSLKTTTHDRLVQAEAVHGFSNLDPAILNTGLDPTNSSTGVHQHQQAENVSEWETKQQDASRFTELLRSADAISALKGGVDAFSLCIGCIFHIYSRQEAESLLTEVLPDLEKLDYTWDQLIFVSPMDRKVNALLCAVTIMGAIGLQYTRDPIPAMSFTSSIENGTYCYTTIFYNLSKALLQDAIEENSLGAMKICASLSVFNIMAHSTMALAFTGKLSCPIEW
jgi:hypothetical protein